MGQMKTCTKCGDPNGVFSKNSRNLDGLRSWCKVCEKIANANHRTSYPEKHNVAMAKWRAANPQKARKSVAKYQAANIEKVRAYNVRWKVENQEACRIYEHNRRARKREVGGELSTGLAEKLFKLQKGKCPCCEQPLGDDYHLDHILPLALGGANEDQNMQLLRAQCNMQKHAKHPIAFMQSRGFLL